MISRRNQIQAVVKLLRQFPVVAVVGARQVGKTTLGRQVGSALGGMVHWFDLEDPTDAVRLIDPALALRELRGLVVVDEIQHAPGLFDVLRVLADRPRRPARFLVFGSASSELLRQSAESLAGRVAYHVLGGFTLDEVPVSRRALLWERGGFPRSLLARSSAESLRWRQEFITTVLERDLPRFGIRVPATTMRRFWNMLAHYHGQTLNSSELARAFAVSDAAIRHYLDILSATYLLTVLPPYHANIKKRQVRAPKLYVSDSGLLHALLNLKTSKAIEGHPKVGASWEGYALQQVIRATAARADECFYWATHTGAELDLVIERNGQRFGFEFKRTSAPTLTPSMRSGLMDLGLERLYVVFPGAHRFALAERVEALPISELAITSPQGVSQRLV
jgi:uncharacterized protein